jgi:putative sigma-54 modulation protein
MIMNISITFRHVESTDAIKTHATDKVAKLQKFLRQPMTAKVTLSVETHEQVAEVRVSSGSEHFEAKERSQDMYQAIDKVIHKLERQVQHSKGAHEAKRRRHDAEDGVEFETIPSADDIAS